MAHFKLILITWIYTLVNCNVFGSKQWDCNWSYENANFSLCTWQQTADSQGKGYWEVYAPDDDWSNNYTYQFNICGDVVNQNNLNEMCTNNTLRKSINIPVGYCNGIVNGTYNTKECKCIKSVNGTCVEEDISAITANVAAYQMPRQKSKDDCYRLHDGITPPIFSLLDDKDPSIGVSIKYVGGDWCPDPGKNREFVINFYCADNYENVPDIEETIPEDPGDKCRYILEIDSSIGCPLQCKVINDKVCDGNGICQYDETNRAPKCFCYEGFYGEDCSEDYQEPTHIEVQHDDTGDIILLIIAVIVLTVIMLIVIYLLVRVYRVKMGTSAHISEEDMAVDIQQHHSINSGGNNVSLTKSEKKKDTKKIAIE